MTTDLAILPLTEAMDQVLLAWRAGDLGKVHRWLEQYDLIRNPNLVGTKTWDQLASAPGATYSNPKEEEKIELTECQKKAWVRIQNWIQSDRPYFNLRGYAGTGKCVVGSTLVGTSNGLLTLRELFKEAQIPLKRDKETEVLLDGFRVDTALGRRKIGGFYTKEVTRTVRVKTSNMLYLEGTPNHKVKTLTSQGFKWIPLENLSEGDVIVGSTSPKWPGTSSKLLCKNTFVSDLVRSEEYRNPTPQYETPVELTFELARLLGYLVADGYMAGSGFKVTNFNRLILKDLSKCIETCFPDVTIHEQPNTLTVRSKHLRLWLHHACGFSQELACKSRHKQIPEIIRRAPKEFFLEFLGAYLSCDSELTNAGLRICSASKNLVAQLITTLTYHGLQPASTGHTRKSATNGSGTLRSYYHAFYNASSVKPLLQALKLLKPVPRGSNQDQRRLPDIVVEAWKTLRSAFVTVNNNSSQVKLANGSLVPCKLNSLRKGLLTSRAGSGTHLTRRAIQGLNLELAAKINPEAAFILEQALNPSCILSTVKAVSIRNRKTRVYDVCVPGPHEFLANGLVNHNTFLMKMVLQLDRHNCIFSAPTNKATKVLSDFLGLKCRTTYSVLGLRMTADEDKKKITSSGRRLDLGRDPILVIDECGMIPSFMVEIIIDLVRSIGLRVMFVGDPAQLNPVGERRSQCWDLAEKEDRALLREVKRYDNQLLDLSMVLRAHIKAKDFNLCIEPNNDGHEGVFVTPRRRMDKLILSKPLDYWRTSKVAAWRNKTVDGYNQMIRANLGLKNDMDIGDQILLAEPIMEGQNIMAYTDEEFTVSSIQKRTFKFEEGNIPSRVFALDGSAFTIAVPDNPATLETLLAHRASKASAARNRIDRAAKWKDFWALKESFTKVRHAYALTAHRLQGSSVDDIYVDRADVMANQDGLEALRCMYVLATRPRKSFHTV